MRARVVIAGGSGFVGRDLLLHLRNYDVVVLSRQPFARQGAIEFVHWDGKTSGPWIEAIDGAQAVINLTGKNINTRLTPESRREIVASRVDSVHALGHAIASATAPPAVLVQASATGFYGDTGDAIVDESWPNGSDFYAEVCREWESAAGALPLSATRRVILRIGIVLGRGGGALKPLASLTRAYLGGAAGRGRQFMSWIHIDDLCFMIARAINDGDMRGVYNAVAPEPVRNAAFMRELRHVLHRPWSPPVPVPLVRLGATFMGTEADLALHSCRCVPKHFQVQNGFFAHPYLGNALRALYRR